MSIEDGCKSLWYIKYVVLKEKKIRDREPGCRFAARNSFSEIDTPNR